MPKAGDCSCHIIWKECNKGHLCLKYELLINYTIDYSHLESFKVICAIIAPCICVITSSQIHIKANSYSIRRFLTHVCLQTKHYCLIYGNKCHCHSHVVILMISCPICKLSLPPQYRCYATARKNVIIIYHDNPYIIPVLGSVYSASGWWELWSIFRSRQYVSPHKI